MQVRLTYPVVPNGVELVLDADLEGNLAIRNITTLKASIREVRETFKNKLGSTSLED